MPRKKSGQPKMCSCGPSCLGPLTFYPAIVGDYIVLSDGDCRAERVGTFCNSIVFTSRPVGKKEKIRLRVETEDTRWCGTLRLGFTSVPPESRTVPLPSLFMPDLCESPGNWGVSFSNRCQPGSKIEFWFEENHKLCLRLNKTARGSEVLPKMDISKPLWGIVELYGQTTSVSLLGSVQGRHLRKKKSCSALHPHSLESGFRLSPTPTPNPNSDPNPNPIQYMSHPVDTRFDPPESLSQLSLHEEQTSDSERIQECVVNSEETGDCVVCMVGEVCITLVCGHRCLCTQCLVRVIKDFGTCPLCRHKV